MQRSISRSGVRNRVLFAVMLIGLVLFTFGIASVSAQDTTVVPTVDLTAAPAIVDPTLVVPTVVFSTPAPAQVLPDVVVPRTFEVNPDVPVLPATLERLSWGAIIAGTIIVLILMFLFNLIGLAIGLAQINPQDHDSPEAGTFATVSLVWVLVSNLLALFIGGFMAGYFAGIPDGQDGLYHGILTWGISGIITALLLLSGLGRLLNGLSSVIGTTLNLAGAVTGGLARGAASVVGGVAGAAGNVVSGAAGAAGNLAGDALSTLARGVRSGAEVTAQGVANLSDNAIEQSPLVRDALNYQDLTRQDIEYQAQRLMEQAGISREDVEGKLQETVEDARMTAQAAFRDPQNAGRYISLAVQRFLARGEDVIDNADLDRESLVRVLSENTGMDEQQINEQVDRWTQQFNQARERTTAARDQARQRAEQFRDQAEQRANELYQQAQESAARIQQEAESRLAEARDEAEKVARETATKASRSLAIAAGVLALSMILGAAAAGIGGSIGAPSGIPEADVIENDDGVSYLPELSTFDTAFVIPPR